MVNVIRAGPKSGPQRAPVRLARLGGLAQGRLRNHKGSAAAIAKSDELGAQHIDGGQYMTQDKRRALGRGLETLLPSSQQSAGSGQPSEVSSQQPAVAHGAAGPAAAAVAIKTADGELRELTLEEIERNPDQT